MWAVDGKVLSMELLEIPFIGPVLPATVAVGLAVLWSMLTTLGAIGGEGWFGAESLVDVDADAGLDQALGGGVPMDAGASGAAYSGAAYSHLGTTASTGFQEAARNWFVGNSIAALRWLNLGGVPLMIWGAVFAVSWWFIAGVLWIAIDQRIFEPTLLWSSLLSIKNLILAALLTKLVTKPLKRSLTPDRITIQSLIGKECVISSTEATPEFGLVKFRTGGAPLLLNVRTDGPRLVYGTPVWIVHYDRKRRVYLVSPTSTRQIDAPAEKLQGESKHADI